MASTNTVDTLNVRIDADLRPLKRALRSTQRSVQQTSDKMKKSFRGIGASVTALGKKMGGLKGIIGGAVIGTLGVAIGAIGKTAATFQDLQQTLDTVFGGMEEGQAAMDFIKQFAQTTPFDIQTLSKAFIQLKGAGIQPTVELLNTFGDAASATTNKVQAFETMVRIATRAVGGGLGLEELEQLVSAGIPVYQILQDELGVTRGEISELGQSAEGATSIMDALQRGLNKEFGGGMERSANNLSTAFSNMKIAATDILVALGEGVGGTGLTGALTFASNTFSQLFVIIKPLAHVIGSVLGVAIRAIIAPIRLVTEGILMLGRGMAKMLQFAANAMPKKFAHIKEAADNLSVSLADLEERMAGTGKEAKAAGGASTEFTAALDAQALAAKRARAELAGYSKEEIAALEQAKLFDDMSFGMGFSGTPLDLVPDVTQLLQAVASTQLYRDQLQFLEDEKNANAEADQARLEKSLKDSQLIKDTIAEIERETKAKFQEISTSISAPLADALVEGKSILGALSDVFKGFVKTMLTKAIELMFVNAILNSIFGLTGGSALPTIPIPGRASGGSVSGGQPYLVGERGPELFVPSGSGTIKNNSDTSSMGGGRGTVINQVINVSAGVSQTVRDEMNSLLPRIKQETMMSIADAKRRGGAFGAAMG